MRSPTAAPDGRGSDALQSIDAGTQQQSSALDGVRRRDQPAAVLLNGTQLRQLLGFGHTKFWQLKRAGALDVLKAPLAGYLGRKSMSEAASRCATTSTFGSVLKTLKGAS